MKGIVWCINKNFIPQNTNLDFKYYIKRYGVNLLLLIYYFISLIFGIVFAKNDLFSNILTSFFGLDLFTNSKCNFIDIFSVYISSDFVLLLVMFILGMCAVGGIFLPFVFPIKAFGTGAIIYNLYSLFHLKGVLFYMLTMFIGDVIFLVALIGLFKTAICTSVKLGKFVFFNCNLNVQEECKNLTTYSCYIIVLTLISALINTVLHFIFSGLNT